jgi:hypothetical protein
VNLIKINSFKTLKISILHDISIRSFKSYFKCKYEDTFLFSVLNEHFGSHFNKARIKLIAIFLSKLLFNLIPTFDTNSKLYFNQ